MKHYESIDDVPALPTSEGEFLSYQSDLRHTVQIGWAGIDRWVLLTNPDDNRQGYLERSRDLYDINVSGNPTGSGISLATWQEAVGLFF